MIYAQYFSRKTSEIICFIARALGLKVAGRFIKSAKGSSDRPKTLTTKQITVPERVSDTKYRLRHFKRTLKNLEGGKGTREGEVVLGGGVKTMKNRKIEQKNTKQIVIDEDLHRNIKSKVAGLGKSIKEYVETLLNIDLYGK